jgi:hypothetical protein
MARPLRIELPGSAYEVNARGDRRKDIQGLSPVVLVDCPAQGAIDKA